MLGGEILHFYKQEIGGVVVAWITGTKDICDNSLTEVSQEEYTAAIEELNLKFQQETETAAAEEKSKDERIAELEEENAALLYQILTGEELSDV